MLDVLGKSPMKDRIDACDEELMAETDGKPGDDPSKKTGPLSIKEAEEGNQDDDTEHPVPGKATPLPSSTNDDVKKWIEYARNKVHRHVKLIPDPGSALGVTQALKDSPIGQLRGTPGESYVGILYEFGKAGEASARPHLRIANYREEHVTRTVKGALMAASEDDEMSAGHAFFFFDGKARNHNTRSGNFIFLVAQTFLHSSRST